MVPTMRPHMKSGDVKLRLKPSTLNLIESFPCVADAFNATRKGELDTLPQTSLVSTD